MDRETWMYNVLRTSDEYVKGVNEFITCASEHHEKRSQEQGKRDLIVCPCYQCGNLKKFPSVETLRDHLFRHGFKKGYTNWFWHGEGIDSRKSFNDENDANNMATNDEDDDEDVDRIDEMLQDVEDHLMHRPDILDNLVNDSKKPLYTGCKEELTKLSTTLKLCKLKVKHGWTDKSFTELLKFLGEILPHNNELPSSTYEAKKILCPMGMDVNRIHACPNDCVLFRNEYEYLHTCPKCGASRYKREGDNTVKDEKRSAPAKVMWYLPIVSRFKRLFANKKDAQRLRWHADGRKVDGMLRHPADSPQWRTVDGKFPEFGADSRNLRLGLCADGMSPYRTLSCQHSTWPVLLTIYNLPPWLCMKRKYMMLASLISGPKEPGNNIDTYLQPLIDDLKLLWEEGVMVYDAYSEVNFNLRAMIFCTTSDFPAYGNLSGYSTKGAKACPICEDATIDIRLKHCKKNVYMGHRTFLPPDHPYRKKKKEFDGHIETRVARLPLTGKEVYERVKDINVELGKLYKRPGEKSIWKKRSIFWDLPYWEHLQVRHCLDFMHIEKNVCESLIGTLLNIPGKTKDGIKARLDMKEMGIRKDKTSTYITNFMLDSQSKPFILAPYIQNGHWMLILICLRDNAVYVFDSLNDTRNLDLRLVLSIAYRAYIVQRVRTGGNKSKLDWFDVECPQQGEVTKCGYYVMRFMYDIVMEYHKNPEINWKEVLCCAQSYTRQHIDEIRELWAEFFMDKCL